MNFSKLGASLVAGSLLLGTSGMASAYYYSGWGHNVYPSGATKHLSAQVDAIEPDGQFPYEYAAWWRNNSNNALTNSPPGNTWARAGGYCGSTFVQGAWVAPNNSAAYGGVATVNCSDSSLYNTNSAYGMIASDGYSSFTY